MNKNEFLKEKADFIRKKLVDVACKNGAGHIAPSLSSVDILTALYYDVMNYNIDDSADDNRDRLIFSKGHGCYALYTILADKGVIPTDEWDNFYSENSTLSGCIEKRVEYGLEAGCGSLGHGLPIAVGLAFGAKLQKNPFHTFCIVGDGELQEGTTWEAVQFAMKHEVANLTIVVDCNRLQAMDFTENIMDMAKTDVYNRFKGFGLDPVACFGHDVVKIADTINDLRSITDNKPNLIIADTVKGYGLKCMENVPKFHFRIPTDEELDMGRSYE